MISRNVTFSAFAQSKLALLRALDESVNPIQVEKRDLASYARFILQDDAGKNYPINLTPSHRIELFWQHDSQTKDVTLVGIDLIREGTKVGTINPEHITNHTKFKSWIIQNTYCYFE